MANVDDPEFLGPAATAPAGSPGRPRPGDPSDGPVPAPSGGRGCLARFNLVCEIDGKLAVARWAPGSFVCDPDLLDTAAVLVSMGEVVGEPELGPPVQATVAPDDPLRMLLTLVRAADRVVDCRVTFADQRPVRSGA